jgi:hypothetical protein
MGPLESAEASVMSTLASNSKLFCAFVVAAALAGCAGLQNGVAAQGGISPAGVIPGLARGGGTWMLPEAKTDELIYTSDYDLNEVFVLSYSTGKLVGTIAGLSQPSDSLCADRLGNVFVGDGDRIVEYAHGGTQSIASLNYPGASASSCSVDPKTGNLAVTNFDDSNVAIFPKATGSATIVKTNFSAAATCAYDDKGNLFVDEGDPYDGIVLEELRAKQTTFTTIKKGIGSGFGPLQWHDGYLLYNIPTIWRLKIADGQMTLAGATILAGSPHRDLGGNQFSVQNGYVVAAFGIDLSHPTAYRIGVWRYPGGQFVKAFRNFGAVALAGLAISRNP